MSLSDQQIEVLEAVLREIDHALARCRQRLLTGIEARQSHTDYWDRALASVPSDSDEWRIFDRERKGRAAWWKAGDVSGYVDPGDCENFEHLRNAIQTVLGARHSGPSPDLDDRLPLFRRRVFDSDLVGTVEAAIRTQEPLTLIMIDLDRFKAVNDQHGHLVGDEVLLDLSQRVAKRIRNKGSGYRYGGEEIAVLLPNYSSEEALALAERLRKDIEGSPTSSGNLNVTASFGIASVPEHTSNPNQLLQLADAALYEAKEMGRNCVRISGEPKLSQPAPREVQRREPDPGSLSDKQRSDIRLFYFQEGRARCPKDNAWLKVQESHELGKKTPNLFVSCPVCGLVEKLPGS